MAKRKETIQIERMLHEKCKQGSRTYGCEEVLIGFSRNRPGNKTEIVDFCIMDNKGIVSCYEIKVTLEDLKSKAAKSFYGHKNYLVVTSELYKKVDDWSKYIPDDVGIIIAYTTCMESARRCKKRELDVSQEIMMKESMIRSLYYKMNKYKSACDMEQSKEKEKESNGLDELFI